MLKNTYSVTSSSGPAPNVGDATLDKETATPKKLAGWLY